jgi:D-glycero-D-manno-heptose 1,7-bisphosphate phosphatase
MLPLEIIRFSNLPVSSISSAILLDRDGVINKRIPGGYVLSVDDFELTSQWANVARNLAALGQHVFILSNQGCIEKGLLPVLTLADITDHMFVCSQEWGLSMVAAYYCPHSGRTPCRCRKPNTGLFQAVGRDFGLDLNDCVMIGDSSRDISAAAAVDCPWVLVQTDNPNKVLDTSSQVGSKTGIGLLENVTKALTLAI